MIQKALMAPPASATESDRLIAAGLAADLVVMNDELAGVLLEILRRSGETEPLRARAAISLGPVLEQTDLDGFDDPLDLVISERTSKTSFTSSIWMPARQKRFGGGHSKLGSIPDRDTTHAVLAPFADSEDEDIKEAVDEALMMLDEDNEEFEDAEDEEDRVN
jgi:hypothetical protein